MADQGKATISQPACVAPAADIHCLSHFHGLILRSVHSSHFRDLNNLDDVHFGVHEDML